MEISKTWIVIAIVLFSTILLASCYSEYILECNEDTHFLCDNDLCILKEHLCDGHSNCRDNSDESPLFCDNSPMKQRTVGYVIIFPMLLVILAIICIALLIFRRKKRKHAEPTVRMTPYQAVHPTGFFICQNPAGPTSLKGSDGGFLNPCYPYGIPPPAKH